MNLDIGKIHDIVLWLEAITRYSVLMCKPVIAIMLVYLEGGMPFCAVYFNLLIGGMKK